MNLAGAGAFGRFANRTPLDLGRAVRHTNQDSRTRAEVTRRLGLADEMLQHLLGDREIGDDAVFQGPNRRDIARCAAEHVLCLGADGLNHASAAAAVLPDCDDRRFIEHDAVAPRVNKCISGAKVDRQVIREITQEIFEHAGRGPERVNGVIYQCPRHCTRWRVSLRARSPAGVQPRPKPRNCPVSLDKDQVQHIALLARLRLADDEFAQTVDKLSRIVDFVDQLSAAPTDEVVPMAHPLNQVQRLRPDQVTETDNRDEVQKNAPSVSDGLYLVPKVIE